MVARVVLRTLLLTYLAANFACASDERADSGSGADLGGGSDTGGQDASDAGGSDAGDAGTGDPDSGVMPGPRPVFSGPSVVYAEGPNELRLAWVAATDDATGPEAIAYHLYWGTDGTQVEAQADAGGDGQAIVVGQTTGAITGLTASTDYFVVVIAEDGEGLRSVRRPAQRVHTPARALALSRAIKVLADLDLTVTPRSLDHFDVSGPDLGQLSVGDFVLAENEFGRALVKIQSLTPNGNVTTMITEKAALDEVVTGGELQLSGVLPDPSAFESANSGRGPRRAYYRDPRAGLTLEQTRVDRAFLGPRRLGASGTDVSLEEDVVLDYGFTWEVGYEANVVWPDSGIGTPESVTAIFTGKLGVEGEATYTLNGSAEYEVERELLSRTLTFTYVVGGLPVLQQVSLKVMAKLEMKAEAEFKAGMTFSAEKEIRVGFSYNPEVGFFPIKDDGFTQETTFSLEGEATAEAKLSIYPVVSTTFYGVATGAIQVDPRVELEAKADLLALPPELTQFDVDFSVGAQINADLTVFGKELAKWESDRYELYRVPIFSLPELQVLGPKEATICHPAKLYLKLSNGYRNTVRPENISWSNPDVSPTPNNLQAELMTTTPGEHTIKVSAYGDGPLGVLGTRRSEITIDVTDPGVDCSMVSTPTTAPVSCLSNLENGFTGPAYFSHTRAGKDDADVKVYVPIKNTRFGAFMVGAFHQYHESTQFQDTTRAPGIYLAFNNFDPFEGDYEHPWVPLDTPPDDYTFNVVYHTSYSCDPNMLRQESCQSWGWANEWINLGTPNQVEIHHSDIYEQSSWIGPGFDPITAYEGEACDGWTGIPLPVLHYIAPYAPKDQDDDPAEAPELPHGFRMRGRLEPFDHDFRRYTPAPAPAPNSPPPFVYDQTRPTPDCYVEVKADGDPPNPPVIITVYEGAENAGTQGQSVIEGPSPVRFLPDPTKIYFARFRYQDPNQSGDYLAEIQSDCTAETPFPEMTGPPTVTSTVPTWRQTIDVTVPVNMLARAVAIDLLESVDGSTWSAGRAAVDIPNGATSVTVPVYVNNGGFPPGRYYVSVQLYAAPLIDSQTLLSTYDRRSTVSSTEYTWRKQDFVAGTDQSVNSGVPIQFLQPNPP